ncbi:unnamed protein product [Closterium sp. Naga37s-1]|nr:unnamed protein product [Closterium sp. Naga37s-1]
MGILAFEVAGLMHRVLDLWSQLEPGHVAELRQQLQSENLERLGVGDFTFRWRMAGLEYSNELLLLTAGVAALARQSGGAVGGQVQQVLRAHARRREKREKAVGKAEADEVQQVLRAHARRREKREKAVGKAEADEVMRFLRDHLGPTGILKREMEALDEAIASTSSDGDAYSFEDKQPTQTYPEDYFVIQGQKVQQLQRSSLWSHSLERMAKTLAVAVGILWQHLREVYGWPDPIGPGDLEGTVGQAGLPMLYARVLAAVSQLAVTMPGTPAFTDKRKDLYLMLPTFIRHQLHSRLRVSRRRPLDEVLLGELRQLAAQMFCWLMPFSQATLQWVNDRSHSGRVAGRQRVLLVQVGVRVGGVWRGMGAHSRAAGSADVLLAHALLPGHPAVGQRPLAQWKGGGATEGASSAAKAFGLGSTASYSSRRRSSPAPVPSGSPLDSFDPEAALAEGAAEAAAAAAAAAAAGGGAVPSRISLPRAASAAEVLDAPTSSISPPPSTTALAAASAESSQQTAAAASTAAAAAGQQKQQRREGYAPEESGAAASRSTALAAASTASPSAAAAGSPSDDHTAFLAALPRRRQTHAGIAAAAIAAVDAAAAGSAGASSTPPKPTAAGGAAGSAATGGAAASKPPVRRRGRHSRSLSMSDIMPSPSSLTWLVDDSAAAGNGAAAAGGAGGGMGGGVDSLPKFLEELAQHGFVVSAFDRSEGRVLHQAAPLSSALAAPTHPSSSSSSSSLFHNPPGRLFCPDGAGRGSGGEGEGGGKEGRNDKDMSPLDRLLARMPPPRRLQRSTTPPGNRIERAMSPQPDRRREMGNDVTKKRGDAGKWTGGVGDGVSVTVGSGRSGSSRFGTSSSVAMESGSSGNSSDGGGICGSAEEGARAGCDRIGSECSGNGIVREENEGLNGRKRGESPQPCESNHKDGAGGAVSSAPQNDKFDNPLPPQDALAVG